MTAQRSIDWDRDADEIDALAAILNPDAFEQIPPHRQTTAAVDAQVKNQTYARRTAKRVLEAGYRAELTRCTEGR